MRQYLQCRDCDEVIDFPVNYLGYAVSVVPSSPADRDDWTFPRFCEVSCDVLTREIWCGVCNRPSFAERIPSEREFENALGLLRRKKEPSGFDTEGVPEDRLLGMDAPSLLCLAQGLAGRRRGLGGCLWCGGRSYIPLPTLFLRREGEELPQLHHEGCGGKLEPHTLWFLGSHSGGRWPDDGDGKEPRWYDFAGNFLKQSYYPFESRESRMARIYHQ